MMSVMVINHKEVDGFVDNFAPSQQTLGIEKGHGSIKHLTNEATKGLARSSHHLSQNRMKRGSGALGGAARNQERCRKDL